MTKFGNKASKDKSSWIFLTFCPTGTRTHDELSNEMIKRAMASVNSPDSSSKTKNIVLQFSEYWKNGWTKYQHNGKTLMPRETEDDKTIIDYVKLNYMHFHQDLYDIANAFLHEAGITNNHYSVIQWRAEILDLDYVTCANHILTAKDNMMSSSNSSPSDDTTDTKPFVLMSSLNMDKSAVWLGRDGGQDSQDALDLLLNDGGFHKLDTFIEKHKMEYAILSKDIISLALMDQIIAIQAEDFVTCDRSFQITRSSVPTPPPSPPTEERSN